MTIKTTPIAQDELAQLLASRLCHDLISPLGAIGNGIELLEMSRDYPGIAASPEMTLISEAVAAARARIQSFRMGFGHASGDQRVASHEVQALLDGMARQNRLKSKLDLEGDLARSEARMILLAVMCLETALPWGGALTISRDLKSTHLTAVADRTKIDPLLWSWLDGGRACALPAASEVQFPLLAEAARRQNRRIGWAIQPNGADITF